MLGMIFAGFITASIPNANEWQITEKGNEKKLTWENSIAEMAQNNLTHYSKAELETDWRLNDYFPLIYIINLPQAEKRLKRSLQEFYSIGTKTIHVFPAIDGSKDVPTSTWKKFHSRLHDIDSSCPEQFDRLHQRQAGCYMSHYKLVQKVNEAFEGALKQLKVAEISKDLNAIREANQTVQKYSKVLICEDDIGFGYLNTADYTIFKKRVGESFTKALTKLPSNWDILYFIVNPTNPTKKISHRIRKINTSWCFCAYALHHTMYKPFLEHLKKIEESDVVKVLPVDSEISEIQHLHHVYAISPSIVYSFGGESQITGKTWFPWQGQPKYPQD
ncbi:MAG: glycosyltransferase family 25 protein [Parachlamydiaceae bacterium]|nr:glycosyltransferase family 25 protein [Parachlamydiaceae bacterium]